MRNEQVGFLIIDQLIQQGIDTFCLSAGSRSTPLVLSIAEHPQAKRMVHFDERGMAFYALGVAKATGKPVAIVTTSGTAVGNILPAVMEASLDHVPLILLTADRPLELRDCGANQTVDQTKLFANFVHWQVDLPCSDEKVSDRFWVSTVAKAVTYTKRGPVHLNCMFREPLFSQTEEVAVPRIPAIVLHSPKQVIPDVAIPHIEKGLIIVGSGCHDTSPIFELAEKLKWPIFADVLSNARVDDHPCQIAHYDLILKTWSHESFGGVIQFGKRFTSKALAEALSKNPPSFYAGIHEGPERHDPNHLTTHRFECAADEFCQKAAIEPQQNCEWLDHWKEASKLAAKVIHDNLSKQFAITEPGLASLLSRLNQRWDLFLANSMPIRDADMFFYPKTTPPRVFGNRGVSGIDGNIATVAGLASERPILAVIGDMAALHDLNSLALLKKARHPVILLIINNGGCGIFSFMPVAKRATHFEEMFAEEHPFNFSMTAKMFDIPYFHPDSTEELEKLLHVPKTCLIEVTTDRQENVRFHHMIYERVSESLCALSV